MEKINLTDFAESYRKKLSFLVKSFGYNLTENISNGVKNKDDTIYKLSYLNLMNSRLIEVVLIGEDYTTHMFCRLGGVYFKRLDANGNIPGYNDLNDCYCVYDIEGIFPIGNWIFKKVKFKDAFLAKIIQGKYWPEYTKESTHGLLGGLMRPMGIDAIKEKLKEVYQYGYKIDFDESELPPYEQSIMGAKILYTNPITKIWVSIQFQARDQEFYVSSNSKMISDYGETCDSDYRRLKNEMIGVINKDA